LKKDWAALEAAAAEATKSFPTFYEFYWDHARALYFQDKKAQAVAPLKTFIDYCSDEVEQTLAKKWLKEIEESK